jgi:tRNA threonylcarbamoyladenosine biosynthesis protein TsaB
MLIAGISTSSGQFVFLLGEHQTVIYDSSEAEQDDRPELYGMFREALTVCNRKASDTGCIVVDTGPGGTSRVRTGVAFANSLAYSLQIPVCPVSAMELAGIDAYSRYGLPVVHTVKSMKGNAYAGLYTGVGRDIPVKYGLVEETVPELVAGIDRLAVVGDHRELIAQLPALAGKTIIDSQMQHGTARIFIEKSPMFTERGLLFPQCAAPVV